MKIGISLRSQFPLDEPRLGVFRNLARNLPPGRFIDMPSGAFDLREQASNLIEVARTVRDARLDLLLLGDHHALPISNFFQPTPTLGRLLAETGEVPVGILYLAPFYHPVLLAEQVGTLAAFAPEPLVLALGAGEGSMEFGAFGMEERSRGARLEEMIPLMRALLSGEGVTHQGLYYQLQNARIHPIPPEPPPIWIAARRVLAIDRAARLGEGWITDTTASDSDLRKQLAQYQEVACAAGREPLPILRKDVFVGESDEEAHCIVEPILREAYRGMGWDQVVVGSPATCIERLRGYGDMGFSTVLVRPIVGDHGQLVACVQLLGAEVLPELRDHGALGA